MSEPYAARTIRRALFKLLKSQDIAVHKIARFSLNYGFERIRVPSDGIHSSIRFQIENCNHTHFVKIVAKGGRWDT